MDDWAVAPYDFAERIPWMVLRDGSVVFGDRGQLHDDLFDQYEVMFGGVGERDVIAFGEIYNGHATQMRSLDGEDYTGQAQDAWDEQHFDPRTASEEDWAPQFEEPQNLSMYKFIRHLPSGEIVFQPYGPQTSNGYLTHPQMVAEHSGVNAPAGEDWSWPDYSTGYAEVRPDSHGNLVPQVSMYEQDPVLEQHAWQQLQQLHPDLDWSWLNSPQEAPSKPVGSPETPWYDLPGSQDLPAHLGGRRQAMPYSDNTWYHVTDRRNLPKIAEQGLVGSERGTDRVWNDFPVEDQAVYLWPNVSLATNYARGQHQVGGPVRWSYPRVLRVRGIDRNNLSLDHEGLEDAMDATRQDIEDGNAEPWQHEVHNWYQGYLQQHPAPSRDYKDFTDWAGQQKREFAHNVEALRAMPPHLREELARHRSQTNGDAVMHYGPIAPHQIDVGNLNVFGDDGSMEDVQDRFHEENPEWQRGPAEDDDEDAWYEAHDQALDDWMAQQGNWISPEDLDRWPEETIDYPEDDSNTRYYQWAPIGDHVQREFYSKTAAPEDWGPMRVEQLEQPYEFKMPSDVERGFANAYECPECHSHMRTSENGLYCEHCGFEPRLASNMYDLAERSTYIGRLMSKYLTQGASWQHIAQWVQQFIMTQWPDMSAQEIAQVMKSGAEIATNGREPSIEDMGQQVTIPATDQFFWGGGMGNDPHWSKTANDDWAPAFITQREPDEVFKDRRPWLWREGSPMQIGNPGEFHPFPTPHDAWLGEVWENTSPPTFHVLGYPRTLEDVQSGDYRAAKERALAEAQRAYFQQQDNPEQRTAVNAVPGNEGHWVWLDGQVGFGGEHHEIARTLAQRLGYEADKVNFISNTIARNGMPDGHQVAVGTINGRYPQIYNSTVDRNAVWDDVARNYEGFAKQAGIKDDAQQAYQSLVATGGFSLTQSLAAASGQAYFAAFENPTQVIPIEQFTPEMIVKWRHEVLPLLQSDADNLIGGWLNEGLVYLDVSRAFQDEFTALSFARDNNQTAVWDGFNNVEIYVADYFGDNEMRQARLRKLGMSVQWAAPIFSEHLAAPVEKTAAFEQAADGRVILYRGLAFSRNTGIMIANDPDYLQRLIDENPQGNVHWTDKYSIAANIANRNGLPGVVLEGLVNPEDIVPYDSPEYMNLVHTRGVFLPNSPHFDYEREVPLRDGAQVEIARTMFLCDDEEYDIPGPALVVARFEAP